ncbi:MAG: hypothetical protein E7178_03605 [Erysipelotrichaceae bacterium]|jgi:tetrahydromethanopterin S-methyltransferase subunit G|nr:hypothetical protein [Erysipelotrichaceae bacterium]
MTNFEIYKKTLPFSFISAGLALISIAIFVGCPVAGYYLAGGTPERAIIGLVIGFVIGVILLFVYSYLVLNRFLAGQIAMMTQGVANNKLPDHVVKAGMDELKGRFAKITAFFFVTGVIKSMFRQIGRLTGRVGRAIGGQTGEGVASAIDTGVQVLLGYLCDCCLGWVMYRKNESVTKAACEGAVIFFKSGKTLFRNIGRIFGMGIASLLVIGGAVFGGLYAVSGLFPTAFQDLSKTITDLLLKNGGQPVEFITNPNLLKVYACALVAIAIWSMFHSVLVRPFILVGVLRNFIEVGKNDIPTEADIKQLEKRAPKIAKLRAKMDAR